MDRKKFIKNIVALTGLKKTRLSIEIFGNKSALSQKQFSLERVLDWLKKGGYSLDKILGINLAHPLSGQNLTEEDLMERLKAMAESVILQANALLEEIEKRRKTYRPPQIKEEDRGG